MRYLGLCCIVKDEAPFLREWLAYHAALGVEHFFIYDNMSEKPVREQLEGFAGSESLTVLEAQGQALQIPSYRDCLQRFGGDFKWMAFIDVDEFLCPLQDTDLRVLLSEFEDYAALGVNWNMFSSRGPECWHITRPSGLVLENYVYRFPYHSQAANAHIKSVVQPARTVAARNPHFFHYSPGQYCVNAAHFPVSGSAFSFCHYDKVKLNHYYYRSQQDFAEKILRGNADANKLKRDMEMFFRQTQQELVEDRDIARFIPRLRKRLRAGQLQAAARYVEAGTAYEGYMEAALGFFHAGLNDKAAVTLCHAVLEYPERAELWILRAMLARQAGQLDRAEGFLKTAASLENDPLIYREQAAIHRQRGEEDKAAALDAFLKHRS